MTYWKGVYSKRKDFASFHGPKDVRAIEVRLQIHIYLPKYPVIETHSAESDQRLTKGILAKKKKLHTPRPLFNTIVGVPSINRVS